MKCISALSINRRSSTKGFTLVELLVVIGIIALLISILLPALTKARKAANAILCSSNLKQITLGMVMYAQQYKGAIVGNGSTSGAGLLSTAQGATDYINAYDVIQPSDWMSPIARILGVKFDILGGTADRASRFTLLNAYNAFHCPDNDLLMYCYGGLPSNIGTTRVISYNTAYYFQRIYQAGASNSDPVYQGYLTSSYFPNITKVGDASRKIFIGDGAKYLLSGSQPDYNLSINDGNVAGGCFSDVGPFDHYTRSYLPPTGLILAMRHGDRSKNMPGALSTKYRMNCAFFDGHVENMDGHSVQNPSLWVPRGTVVSVGSPYNGSGPEVLSTDEAAGICGGVTYTAP